MLLFEQVATVKLHMLLYLSMLGLHLLNLCLSTQTGPTKGACQCMSDCSSLQYVLIFLVKLEDWIGHLTWQAILTVCHTNLVHNVQYQAYDRYAPMACT